jgi:hypothetical protein
MKKLILLVCMAIPLASFAHEHGAHVHGAHVHGAAEVDVAIEGKKLVITLESPADNLLGFEHAPKTDAEKTKLKTVEAQLRDVATVFAPDAAAQCKLIVADVTMPDFKQGEHSEIAAEYNFECAHAPSQIALPLWKNFPKFKKLTANIAAAAGQKQSTLKPSQAISLK